MELVIGAIFLAAIWAAVSVGSNYFNRNIK